MVKKEISSAENWKEAFWETALCSLNSSHRVTWFPSRSLSLRLFLWNLQSAMWKSMERYGEKGNILRWKLQRSFLRNCFVFCEFISRSYSFPLWKPFAKTVLVEIAKGYLEDIRGLRGKNKSSDENWKEAFREHAFDVWLPLTEIHLYFVELFASLISVESENWYFGSLGGQ